MRTRRCLVSLVATGTLALLVLILASSGIIVTPVNAIPSSPSTPPPSPPINQSHTLVIEQVTGSVGYTLAVAGTIRLQHTEASDTITGATVSGRVGGFPWTQTPTDPRDVIHFTGQLQDFEYNGGRIRVMLDGEPVEPAALRKTPVPPPRPTPATASPTVQSSPPTLSPVASSPRPSAQPSPPASSVASPRPSSSPAPSSGGIPLAFVWGLAGGLLVVGVGVFVVLRQ